MATLKLNGKEYEVKFTYMAILTLEKYYGKGVGKIFTEIDMEAMTTLNVFLWACLKQHKEFNKTTLDALELMLSDAIESEELLVEELGEAVRTAVESSVILKGKLQEGNGKK